jgi:hypothetical protein
LRLDFSLSSCEFSYVSFPFCIYLGRYTVSEDKHNGSRYSRKPKCRKQQYHKCYYSTVTFVTLRHCDIATVPCMLDSFAYKVPSQYTDSYCHRDMDILQCLLQRSVKKLHSALMYTASVTGTKYSYKKERHSVLTYTATVPRTQYSSFYNAL